MSLLSGGDVPYIEVTKDGTTYRLPVQQVGRAGQERPVPVERTPKIAFPQPIAISGPEGGELRRNYDIDEITITDWGGMGTDSYPPLSPPAGHAYGEADTRWPGTLVPRPLATQVGAGKTVGSDPGLQRVVEVGYTNAQLLWYPGGNSSYRLDSGNAWQNTQSGGVDLIIQHLAVGQNGLVAIGNAAGGGVYRSDDGVTWDNMADPGAGGTAIAVFDEKVWVLDSVNSSVGADHAAHTVYSSADLYSAAAGGGTWATGNRFISPQSESVLRLFTWMYPLDRGKETLWCLTSRRLLYYDYYAATPAWRTWNWIRRSRVSAAVLSPSVEVLEKNGNLYVANPDMTDAIAEYTGSAITQLRPNKGGGIPAGRRFRPVWLASNADQFVAFCRPASDDSASKGAAVFVGEDQKYRHLLNDTAKMVAGGGVGTSKAYTVLHSGTTGEVWQQTIGDETTLPEHSTTKTYDAAANTAVSGWLNGRLVNVNKRLLYFEVDAIKADGSPGLDTGCTLQVEYWRRGGSAVSAGTLTASDTFPAVLAVSGGYSFKELRVRVTLDRGGTSTVPVNLKALKVGFRPRPKARYRYTARVDLRDSSPAFATADGLFHGRSASYLRGILDELSDNDDAGVDDTLVALAYGGFGNLLHPRRRSATQCEVAIQGQESPEGGDGLYSIVFNDVSAPTSG